MSRKIKRIDYTEPISLTKLAVNEIPKYLKGQMERHPDLVIKEFENALPNI